MSWIKRNREKKNQFPMRIKAKIVEITITNKIKNPIHCLISSFL